MYLNLWPMKLCTFMRNRVDGWLEYCLRLQVHSGEVGKGSSTAALFD